MNPQPHSRRSFYVLVALVFAAAWSRLVPHWPNFTAVPAMALFAGQVFGRRWPAFVLPLLAMLVSDLALAVFVYGGKAFLMMPVVYAAIAATSWIGTQARRRAGDTAVASLAATAVFFLTVNFYVWLLGDLYPATAQGLAACYLAALPYAANMLASTLLYAFGLLALHQLAMRVTGKRPQVT